MLDELILKVAKERMRGIEEELSSPAIYVDFSMQDDGSGRIDIFNHGELIGQEMIETPRLQEEEGPSRGLSQSA